MNSRKGRGACVFPFPFAPPAFVDKTAFDFIRQSRNEEITSIIFFDSRINFKEVFNPFQNTIFQLHT